MKIFCLIIISSFIIFTHSICNASSSLSQLPLDAGMQYDKEQGFEIDALAQNKYQSAAKLLSTSSSKTVETGLVTYETLPTGVLLHVGWYSDGNICTALNGTEQGKQVVILNGSIVGISYDISQHSDYFVHKYTWGKIYSSGNHQKIKIN